MCGDVFNGSILKWLRGHPAKVLDWVTDARVRISLLPPLLKYKIKSKNNSFLILFYKYFYIININMQKKNILNIMMIVLISFLFITTVSLTITSLILSWPLAWIYFVIFVVIMYFINTYYTIKIFYDKDRINTSKKNWLLGFCLLPGVATFFYLWLGFKPDLTDAKNNYITGRKLIKDYESKPENTTDDDLKKISNFFKNTWDVDYSNNNNIKLIEDNFDLYKKSIDLIRSAEKSIIVQYYIISKDDWFNTFANELIKKSKQGVQIYFLVDWIGSIGRYNKGIINKLRKNNINFELFTNNKFPLLHHDHNTRNHKKILIIDNKKGLYGGSNLSEEYLPFRKNTSYWRDINFDIEGEVVNRFTLNFISDYVNNTKTKETVKQIIKKFENKGIIKLNGSDEILEKNSKSFVMESDPSIYHNPIENSLLQLIMKAKKSIHITTPYFDTTDVILDALITASLSGIDVKILLPGKPDNKNFIIPFNQKNYEKLKNTNIQVFEYEGFYHGKMTLIDDDVSLIGSFNYDLRSIYLNKEDFIISFSNQLNYELKTLFYKDIKHSRLVDLKKNKENKKFNEKVKVSILEIFALIF